MRKLIQFLLFLLLTSCSTYSEQEIQDFLSSSRSAFYEGKGQFEVNVERTIICSLHT